ncbi:MAG: type II toxin-antitoxin system YafQ family toxin [Lachnospiraceae bacterium]|nr:type II toxin-antitoxin system YafQ family toxin [Lachnospiraceae bacterium]
MTKYEIKNTTQFKKDYKLAKRRGLDISLLKDIVTKLANGEPLDPKYKDHSLSGNWTGHRECHIQPDWLLIYRYEENVLILTLTRTGTHSGLFNL